MSKRIFDVMFSFVGLLFASPVLLVVMFLVWFKDRHSPFYVAPRIGKNGMPFQMVKMRSMVINADTQGSTSTSAADRRITPVGHFIRKFKIDELTQLWNVLLGDMSFVGPRPQVQTGVDVYTTQERMLLTVCPGITDFASIVFSDEGDILKDQPDPDIAYNQLIRPGKSMLGLFYIEHRSFILDIELCFLTAIAIVSRAHALSSVCERLKKLGASQDLLRIAGRQEPLVPLPPPGGAKIITARDGNPFV